MHHDRNIETAVIGLGKTGLSCLRFLQRQDIPVAVIDTRQQPPGLQELQSEFPDLPVHLGDFSAPFLSSVKQLIVSPGVSIHQPEIANLIANGVEVIGDIELFARHAQAPIIAITGSNGKTTVTTLMGGVIRQAGYQVDVCGNIGDPVLDRLQNDVPDFYVLELSSFQLETTHSLHCKAAVILNISEDHMDRYACYADYVAAKQRIYSNADIAVVNADEAGIWKPLNLQNTVSFTMSAPQHNQFGIIREQGNVYLAHGDQKVFDVDDMHLKGWHHWQNALAVLALTEAIDLPIASACQVFREFQGLRHRCQYVATKNDVKWYNDSKGTNVGAAIAAIKSLGTDSEKHIVLIAGGDSKGADLTPLREALVQNVKHLLLYGQDAHLFEQLLTGIVPLSNVNTLQEAVLTANQLVSPGDTVLLSPACASYDMFKNFEHRGDEFIRAVQELPD